MSNTSTISKAAAKLGSITTEAKSTAARNNGTKGGRPRVKGPYSPTLHRDGTVTYWSVYSQQWVRSSSLPDQEYAAIGSEDRERIQAHLGE